MKSKTFLSFFLHLFLRFGGLLWRCRELACIRVDTALASAPDTMRLLIVEDEPDLLSSLAQALREEGYAVDTATDGEEGFYKAENSDYDAIVLDVMMPKLDGWGVLQKLRAIKKTPVLMLTARDQTRDRVRGLDTGADDYLIKPFDLDELMARLRALNSPGRRADSKPD